MHAEQLLNQLAVISPHLRHHRSIGRARSTLADIRGGKPVDMLVRNVRDRFSNGHTVQLDEEQAGQVLAIIRRLYQAQDR